MLAGGFWAGYCADAPAVRLFMGGAGTGSPSSPHSLVDAVWHLLLAPLGYVASLLLLLTDNPLDAAGAMAAP